LNPIIIIDGRKHYLFKERRNVKFKTGIKECTFKNEWLQIKNDGTIIVRGKNPGGDGYSWNGCSPKYGIFDIVVGTPDGIIDPETEKPKTYYASMIHDILYQFSKNYKGRIKRKQVDRLFLKEMGNFRLRYLYYLMVRLVGGLFW